MDMVQALAPLNLGGSEPLAVKLREFAAAGGHLLTLITVDDPPGGRRESRRDLPQERAA